MQDAVPENKREKWRQWARNEFGENEQVVQVATETVLNSLLSGYSINEAMDIARAAAAGPSPNLRATASATEIDSRTEAQLPPVSDSERLRGCVSFFRQRNEPMGQQYGTVWNFRVDSWDTEGRAQPAVAVEMRGFRFTGSVGDGDWVEIRGPWKAGHVLPVSSLRNISQNSIVAVDENSIVAEDKNSIVAVDGGGSPSRLNRFAFKLGRAFKSGRLVVFVLVIFVLLTVLVANKLGFTVVGWAFIGVSLVLLGRVFGIKLAISFTTVLVSFAAMMAANFAGLI